jgi:uncharacterized membrane protein
MTGTAGDIIPIVIVPVVVLALWLVMMYRANSHPQWAGKAEEATPERARASVTRR